MTEHNWIKYNSCKDKVTGIDIYADYYCDFCGIKVWSNNKNKVFYKDSITNTYVSSTCEEYIIKNIIE